MSSVRQVGNDKASTVKTAGVHSWLSHPSARNNWAQVSGETLDHSHGKLSQGSFPIKHIRSQSAGVTFPEDEAVTTITMTRIKMWAFELL